MVTVQMQVLDPGEPRDGMSAIIPTADCDVSENDAASRKVEGNVFLNEEGV